MLLNFLQPCLAFERLSNDGIADFKPYKVVIGNPWVLSLDPHWVAFLKFCWRNGLWDPDDYRDPRMPERDEGDVGKWEPSSDGDDKIEGLEAALIYKELEQQNLRVRESVRKFMRTSQDDEMWTSGVEAIEALRLSEEDGEIELD